MYPRVLLGKMLREKIALSNLDYLIYVIGCLCIYFQTEMCMTKEFLKISTGVAKYVKLDSAINLLLLYQEDTTKGVGWGTVGGSEREGGGIFSKWRPYC